MDKLNHYRKIIHQILVPYSQIIYNNADIQNRLAFDPQNDQYLVISEGWQQNQRYHRPLAKVLSRSLYSNIFEDYQLLINN